MDDHQTSLSLQRPVYKLITEDDVAWLVKHFFHYASAEVVTLVLLDGFV